MSEKNLRSCELSTPRTQFIFLDWDGVVDRVTGKLVPGNRHRLDKATRSTSDWGPGLLDWRGS